MLWLALLGSLLLRSAIDDGKHLFPTDRCPLSPRIQTLRGILQVLAECPGATAARQTGHTGGARPEPASAGAITTTLDDRLLPARRHAGNSLEMLQKSKGQ